jgi:hypothetical protein
MSRPPLKVSFMRPLRAHRLNIAVFAVTFFELQANRPLGQWSRDPAGPRASLGEVVRPGGRECHAAQADTSLSVLGRL